jgi:hypothetical protein
VNTGMNRKKLVTLACGACFLPPLPQRPAPPPLLKSHDIHSIGVEVTNVSETHHLDPSDLAQSVVGKLNSNPRSAGIKADAGREAGPEDAVLKVVILSESATSASNPANRNGQQWTIFVNLSATITRNEGREVWRESDGAYRLSRFFQEQDPVAVWKEPFVPYWVSWRLDNRLLLAPVPNQ